MNKRVCERLVKDPLSAATVLTVPRLKYLGKCCEVANVADSVQALRICDSSKNIVLYEMHNTDTIGRTVLSLCRKEEEAQGRGWLSSRCSSTIDVYPADDSTCLHYPQARYFQVATLA